MIALLASSLANFSYVDVNSENIVTAIFMAILGVVSVVLRVLVFSDIRGLSPAAYPKILGLLNYEFAIAVIQGVTLAVSLSGEGSVLAESWIPILGAVLFVLLYFFIWYFPNSVYFRKRRLLFELSIDEEEPEKDIGGTELPVEAYEGMIMPLEPSEDAGGSEPPEGE